MSNECKFLQSLMRMYKCAEEAEEIIGSESRKRWDEDRVNRADAIIYATEKRMASIYRMLGQAKEHQIKNNKSK